MLLTRASRGFLHRYISNKPHRCPHCHSATVAQDKTTRPWRQDLSFFFYGLYGRAAARDPYEFWDKIARFFYGMAAFTAGAKRDLTFASVTCCRCGVEFTRWPNLPVLKQRGVVCTGPDPIHRHH